MAHDDPIQLDTTRAGQQYVRGEDGDCRYTLGGILPDGKAVLLYRDPAGFGYVTRTISAEAFRQYYQRYTPTPQKGEVWRHSTEGSLRAIVIDVVEFEDKKLVVYQVRGQVYDNSDVAPLKEFQKLYPERAE